MTRRNPGWVPGNVAVHHARLLAPYLIHSSWTIRHHGFEVRTFRHRGRLHWHVREVDLQRYLRMVEEEYRADVVVGALQWSGEPFEDRRF